MVFLWTLVGFAILVIAVLYIFGYFRPEPKTPQPKDGWWGRGPEEPDADTSIREFKVTVSNAAEPVISDTLNFKPIVS